MRLGDRMSEVDKRRLAMLYANNSGGFTIPRAGLAASFDAALGITSSGGFASAWADQSGNGRNLLQGAGANQPIHLAFAGTKYGWLPGVAGNYFSTPDSVVIQSIVTGEVFVAELDLAHGSWTGASNKYLITQSNITGNQRAFSCGIAAGVMFMYVSLDGATFDTGTSINSTAALPAYFANAARGKLRYSRTAATGVIQFHYSTDGGATWVQSGTNKSSTAGAIFNSNSVLELGTVSVGTDPGVSNSGKWYSASLAGSLGGTLAVDFNAARYAGGTTLTGSTGETWTINSTGSKPAQIVDRSSLLFDGAAHFMKCNPFTLNQPMTVYVVAKQLSWALGDVVFDGNASNSMLLYGVGVTPSLSMYAGSPACSNDGFTLGSVKVGTCVFNGASSSSQVNTAAAVTGNVGADAAGGFTFGAIGAGTSGWQNMQAYEALIYNVAHDSATSANIRRALMSKHGVA